MKGLREYLQGMGALSRNVWLFLCSALLLGIGRQIFQVLRNQYLVDLGLPDAQVTSVQGFNSVGGLLVAIPAIVIISRFRAKRLLAVLAVLNACGYALQGLFGSLSVFQGAAFLSGMSMSLNMALTAPFLMRNTSNAERVFGFALQSAVSWPLSGVIGSWLSGALQAWFAGQAGAGIEFMGETLAPHMFGYRATLLVAAGSVLLALAPVALLREGAPDGQGKSLAQVLKVHNKKRLLLLGLPEMIIGFGAGLTIPFFNVYFKNEWGMSPPEVARVFMAMFAVLVVSYLATPVLVKRFGPVKVMIACQALSLPFFVELAAGHFLWLAVAAFIARQALMNSSDPIYKQFAQEVGDPRDRNAVGVAVHASRHMFFTVANFLSGYMIAWAGGKFTYVIATTIACYVVAIVVELAILPRLNRVRLHETSLREAPVAPAARA